MKVLLLNAHSQNENYSADCDVFVIPIWHNEVVELRRTTLTCLAVVPEADHYGLEVTVFDYHAFCLSYADASAAFPQVTQDDALLVEDGPTFVDMDACDVIDLRNTKGQRTENDRIHLCKDGMYWSASPKHCDFVVETAEVTWTDLLNNLQTYRVSWEIDIEADSPLEAAAIAKWYQLHGDWSSVFGVTWLDGKGHKEIDLDEELPPEIWEVVRSCSRPSAISEAMVEIDEDPEVEDETQS